MSSTTTRLPSPRTTALLLALVLIVAACGGRSDTAAAGEADAVSLEEPAGSYVFDASMVHDLSVEVDPAAYEETIATYAATGDKEWLTATVTIDGVTYDDVGIRLKGNSSLAGLGGGDGPAGRGGPGGAASADSPEALPWLIRLDKFVDGQNHQGIVDLVVRSNVTSTSLNEAVALELLDLAGLPSSQAAATRFSVNGSDAVLRLVVEHLDDVWLSGRFDGEGVLYKAESTGDYGCRGDDPEAYEDAFDIEAGEGDLTPLIDFLCFVNESDDADFVAGLADRLDVATFATYLAAEELIDNFDDIDGPGNNSYLHYDSDTATFTVVPWDHNLAFGALGEGQGAGTRPGPPGGFADAPQDATGLAGGESPAGFAGAPPTAGDGGGRGGRQALGGNVLAERFLADEGFASLYEEQLAELTETLFTSGAAEDILDRWVAVLDGRAGDLVAASTVAEEAAAIAAIFPT